MFHSFIQRKVHLRSGKYEFHSKVSTFREKYFGNTASLLSKHISHEICMKQNCILASCDNTLKEIKKPGLNIDGKMKAAAGTFHFDFIGLHGNRARRGFKDGCVTQHFIF